jgi:two-component system alkaline phosphatase synthesis response regulator PhoP
MAKLSVLVVDDEKSIVEAVRYNLEKEGFRVLVAHDGVRAVELARREQPDLVLLDWMLPELDGLEVCKALKQDERTKTIPIILLTVKSHEADKVLGLEMGADDYVTKPFSPRELVARVRAVLRRRAAPKDSAELFHYGDLDIDWGKYRVTVKGKVVTLTPKEFELLRALVQAKGRVLSREQLLERVWGYERAVELETRTVDLHVSQLRKKLGRQAGAAVLTVKQAGYRFATDD